MSRGLVVERHRRHVVVATDPDASVTCKSRRRSINPHVGDRVVWSPEPDGTGIVDEILARDSLLTRIDARGRPEPVAANVTCMLVVAAPQPTPDWSLVDRYLAAAELLHIRACIVFNKVDLVSTPPSELEAYRRIGYSVCLTSAKRSGGVDGLTAAMGDTRSVMVGQSGVGKSSLTNALLGTTRQSVGGLTGKGEQGRHTTTSTTLHRLPGGAELIDSPGVRNYAPYIEDARQLAYGFKEYQSLLGRCRFADCQHLAEPDCAIKHARDTNGVDRRRYESYTALLATLTALRDRSRP
jgi:ribosome biogenesis GTPase